MRKLSLLARAVFLGGLLAFAACGGGDDDAGVCERCVLDIDDCFDFCEGDECDRCRECGGGLYCELFIGGTSGLRCADEDSATCCIDNERVDCP